MIPTNKFIDECAALYGYDYVFSDFRKWFLTEYEDEPYPDFYDKQCLEELFHMFYKQYLNDALDITIKSPYKRLKERYEDLKDFIFDLMVDIDALEQELNRLNK